MSLSFICSTCGQTHDGFPALAFRTPTAWDWASDQERAADWSLQGDLCRFKDIDFYVRAVLSLPIIGSDQTLEFGVWSTLSQVNFARYRDSFNDEDQSKLGPMFSWFSNAVPGYPDTVGLACNVLPQDQRQRPLIELEPTDNPLAIHQYEGFTMEQAAAYYHAHLAR